VATTRPKVYPAVRTTVRTEPPIIREYKMRKFLLATVALFSLNAAANAAVISDLGINPTSQTGAFSNQVGGGAFSDQFPFQLVGGPQFFTIASATNVFPVATDFITNFTASLFDAGANGVPGGGDDVQLIGPIAAVPCPQQSNCQGFAGSGILLPGNYFLDLSGTGGGTSGYGGDIATFAVPGPIVGAGLPGLLGLVGFGVLALRRRIGWFV
jgi:hypothetical protein